MQAVRLDAAALLCPKTTILTSLFCSSCSSTRCIYNRRDLLDIGRSEFCKLNTIHAEEHEDMGYFNGLQLLHSTRRGGAADSERGSRRGVSAAVSRLGLQLAHTSRLFQPSPLPTYASWKIKWTHPAPG